MGTNLRTAISAARDYLARGWQVVPIPARTKGPVVRGWNTLRIAAAEVEQHFAPDANIGLILGEPSGWLVDVDLDCEEARRLADQYLPPTAARTGRPSAPDSHRWYVAPGARTAKHADPQTRKMIVELRSTGGQTVVGPSVHPDGEPYAELVGQPAAVAAPMLAACVEALAQAVLRERYGEATLPPAAPILPPLAMPPAEADDFAVERRATAYLDNMPEAISGQGGHNAAYAAATALVHGFALEPERALQLLLVHYNPRCQPPWTEKELRHKVDDAAAKPHDRPHGWLREGAPEIANDVDLSCFGKPRIETAPEPPPAVVDPGPLPLELLRVPGFVSEVMDHCLQISAYPNQAMAFCGALALQAFLGGRKVRDQADVRTNIYLLALAYSAVGKDWPRKLNAQILHEVGLTHCLGERFASGEGLQDALYATPAMLFQTDEFDTLLQSINRSKDGRHEAILSTLLTMFSAANSVYPMRRKAGGEPPGVIDQPCLCVLGTAIPTHYYGALSERLLTNGTVARTFTVEAGRRAEGQEPSILDVPARVMETARYWATFEPGRGNLNNWHPLPAVVPYADAAKSILIESRRACEAEYAKAEEQADAVGTTIWGRVNEQARKLALLYAISVNPRSPAIDAAAASWARDFTHHQARRLLFMASAYVAENPFHADCLKLLQKLREAPEQTLPHSVLLKRMKMDSQSFMKLVQTLEQQGEVQVGMQATVTRPQRIYRLAEGVKDPGERLPGG